MKRLIWPIVALLAIFALGAVVALAVTGHAQQQAVIRTQAATSAATSIIAFLLAVILALVLAVTGAAIGRQWWKRHQRREKMREALAQAQVYALLQGARLPPAPRRPSMPAGGNVIVLPGGSQRPQPTLDDFRRMIEMMQEERPDPLAGLLPPDDWEVLG